MAIRGLSGTNRVSADPEFLHAFGQSRNVTGFQLKSHIQHGKPTKRRFPMRKPGLLLCHCSILPFSTTVTVLTAEPMSRPPAEALPTTAPPTVPGIPTKCSSPPNPASST